jgi:tetratricopeptide (TPR) repeat protein
VIAQQPDAVLIYAGHNEYYGALGVGSSSQLGSFPALVRLALRLREFRLIQLFYDAYFSLLSISKSSEPDLQENLMKRMVRQQEIPHDSDIYRAGIAQFDSNMDLLLEKLTEAKVPVYLSKLVSNEKDQPPFISRLSPHSDQQQWAQHFEKMKRAQAAGNFEIALEAAQQALDIDSTNAELHFLSGQMYRSIGQFAQALKAFQKAALYDQLRFRAPPEINQLITQKSVKYKVSLVDTEEHMRQHSPDRIIGAELVLEHLHPNLDGYMLMADAFYNKLLEQPILPGPLPVDLAKATASYPTTEVDSLYGLYTTMILKQGWPFFEETNLDTTNRTLPEAIAGALAVKQLSWEAAMEKLYQHYHQQDVLDSALKVMEAVILEYPDKTEFYAKAGSLGMRMGAFDKGSAFFTKAFERQKDARFAYYAALCMVQNDQIKESADFLQASFQELPPDTKSLRLMTALRQIVQMEERLARSEDPLLLNSLARNYFLVGLGEKARSMAEQSLILEPENAEAVKMLQQIDAHINS